MDRTETQPHDSDKLSYHAPVLREHGSVDELTKGGSTNFDPTADSTTGYDDPTPSLS